MVEQRRRTSVRFFTQFFDVDYIIINRQYHTNQQANTGDRFNGRKRYVAKKRIPEYCPFGSVMSLKVESENDAPACFGRVVGYQYEGSDEVVSTIEGDNLKAKGERIIDRLMYDGYLVKHQTVKKIDNLGTVNVTQYGIMYEAESAAQHKGTPTHGIPSPTAGLLM